MLHRAPVTHVQLSVNITHSPCESTRLFSGSDSRMTLDSYFSKIPDTMTRPKGKKATTNKPASENEEQNKDANAMEATDDENASSAGSIDPNILQAMDRITNSMTKVIDTKAATRDQTTQIQALGVRVGKAEGRIASVEDTTESLLAKVTNLEKQISDMFEHMDDLENRGHRCNVRLTRLPEDTEGPDPVNFIEKWLNSYLNITTKNGRIKLDHAHRSLAPKPGPKQYPRPIIMKFHNFTDKQRVMNAAHRLRADPTQPVCTGPQISFFDNYSASMVKKHKAFDEVKDRLRKMNIDYALMYPATLKVTDNGTEKRFGMPEAGAAFADTLG